MIGSVESSVTLFGENPILLFAPFYYGFRSSADGNFTVSF